METNDKSIEYLKKVGADYNELKKGQKKYISEIENIIGKYDEQREEAIELLKSSHYNVSRIASDLNISRTTLYSNDGLLKKYIEYHMADSNKKNPLDILADYEFLLSEMRHKVQLMELRDLKFLKLQDEIEYLNKQVEQLTKDNQKWRSIAEKSRKKNV